MNASTTTDLFLQSAMLSKQEKPQRKKELAIIFEERIVEYKKGLEIPKAALGVIGWGATINYYTETISSYLSLSSWGNSSASENCRESQKQQIRDFLKACFPILLKENHINEAVQLAFVDEKIRLTQQLDEGDKAKLLLWFKMTLFVSMVMTVVRYGWHRGKNDGLELNKNERKVISDINKTENEEKDLEGAIRRTFGLLKSVKGKTVYDKQALEGYLSKLGFEVKVAKGNNNMERPYLELKSEEEKTIASSKKEVRDDILEFRWEDEDSLSYTKELFLNMAVICLQEQGYFLSGDNVQALLVDCTDSKIDLGKGQKLTREGAIELFKKGGYELKYDYGEPYLEKLPKEKKI